eukprot:g37724.t1
MVCLMFGSCLKVRSGDVGKIDDVLRAASMNLKMSAASSMRQPTNWKSTERSVVQQTKKKELNQTPPGGCRPRIDLYAQAVRRYINAKFVSCAHKIAQNITQAQRNAIHALKSNHNIVIKPADKGGAIVIQNRMDYCREGYRQLNNQENYRQLPANLTKEPTRQLNRLINTFEPDHQSILCPVILHTSHIGGFYGLLKIHKFNTPGHPIVSGNGTLCENLSGNVEAILKPIVRGTTSFLKNNNLLRRRTQDTTDRVPFIIQYFPRAEKLHHALCSLQHVIDEHLTKIFPTPPLLTFKQ